MQPRWQPDQHGTPIVPKLQGGRSSGAVAREFIQEPLPDLEQQLAAELEGVSWAVVAFTLEDTVWCDWIYRNLNGYPLPVALVDRVTAHGFPRPDCLSIFPDRRDPNYADHLPHALEESSYLVVVCSPDSANSEAVDEQIRAFKKAGGEERVLALVVDGPPDARLGEHRRAAKCEWLPTWLRWRLEENGFRAADRWEPRVIDARRGYRSLKQVRDCLLAALIDADVEELDRLGACTRNVEALTQPAIPAVNTVTPKVPVPSSVEKKEAVMAPTAVPAISAAPAAAPTPLPMSAASRRGSKFTIGMAVGLIIVAVVFGTHVFREITAEDPASTLEVAPVTGVMAGRSAKPAPVEEAKPGPQVVTQTSETVQPVETTSIPAQTVAVASESAPTPEVKPTVEAKEPTAEETTPGPALTQNTQPTVDAVPEVKPPPPTPPVAVMNVREAAPTGVWATSRIQSMESQTPSKSAPEEVVAVTPSPTGIPASVPANSPNSSESDAVLLDEVKTLERRGDETMTERRTEDALDLYRTALSSAEEYAARKGANPAARDQVVALMRKLGTLQMQNSSTAEARATFIQARKLLLQIKSQGGGTRERAKALDEIESRLLSLPKD
ncbi:hypothetical protein CfE428DRAFT_4435 [Chthoniobacter flavus Ellin428]|uniref:Uncharacterized protein n=1 Tax=Chthoniobacter flavus Ellin428 TaxID=497964 RepID=B4D696_9BACT|nr:TIR domain-containing protein [Chthoniobacter flavus]EDY18005.1 hypothetical protein CfE428DRAFT_4435 [Chthoniobacter flavus Ellin428]TCO88247.1 hypothetical protein EV701_11843 [Chthoniobacter flavus]